ncbi:NAD(P)/FAD-dependent oxidoreductase [Segetibacter aerophilus]|uniref:NADH:ubiquinone reductase (non-electrogenic) n=1 Tax=Segetibacter aerophilus TaxID=670293 RepID=A0A512BH35_9BACT|nr:NAD(P)/FAD-dependent oxidoreductase [Segetibacter aerophilus]GEO11281.1 NADH dehydrogenase [Segetibacter aerophilus]
MTTNTVRPRIVIVGGGFGGLELAKHLKDQPVEVIMLDRHNYHTFQPLLYQVATGALDAETITFPLRRIFQNQKNFSFSLAEVSKINPEKNTVETAIGEIAYDYLVLATGADTNFFGNKQLEHFAMGMKSVPEALNIRSMILQSFEAALSEKDPGEKEELMTFVIVGGGPTGVELAGALAEFRTHILEKDYPKLDDCEMRVFVVEGKPKVLGVMSEKASSKAQKYLQDMGVIIYNDVHVQSFDGELLTIDDGRELRTRNVLWAAGVVGQFPEGISEENIVKGRRIQADEINKVKGYTNIFAIGDVAAVTSADTPNGYPGVAQVALQQGKQLAKNLVAIIEGKETSPFKYKDMGSMATIGRNKAVADLGKFKFAGFFAWLLWCFVHVFSLVGIQNKITVFIRWLGRYFSYNGPTRIIVRPFSRESMTENTAAK